MNKYTLLKTQRQFLEIPHNRTTDVACYQGGYGSGKTFSGTLLGTLLLRQVPGIKGMVGAMTYGLVRDTTLVSYFEHFDNIGWIDGKHYKYLKSDQIIEFKNGSSLYVRHFDNPHVLKSFSLGFAQIEEMSDVPESTFNMLISRLRQAGIKRYRLFGHTNPEPKKGWIYRNFIENPRENYRLLIAPTTENIVNLPDDFIENMRSGYSKEYFDVNVMGNFADFTSGLLIKGFLDDVNNPISNVKNMSIDYSKPLHLTCDFNVDPMCWFVFQKDKENYYFLDEIVIENTITEKTCLEFINRYKKTIVDNNMFVVVNGDASGDSRSTQSADTNYAIIYNTLNDNGIRIETEDFHLNKGNPPIEKRINAFNAKVRNAKGEPFVFVDPKCEKLLMTMNNVEIDPLTNKPRRATTTMITLDKNSKYYEHILDAVSYPVDYYDPISLIHRNRYPEKPVYNNDYTFASYEEKLDEQGFRYNGNRDGRIHSIKEFNRLK